MLFLYFSPETPLLGKMKLVKDSKVFIVLNQLVGDHFEFIVDEFGQFENCLIIVDNDRAATTATGITETAVFLTCTFQLSHVSNVGTESLWNTATTIEFV